MKLSLLLLTFLLPLSAFSQTHTFPATDTANTFTGTNVFSKPLSIGVYTVAILPSASTFAYATATVTDGATRSDCTIGGGSFTLLCVSNGSAWSLGSGGTPATPTTSVQFNSSGSFGGDSQFVWDNTNKALTVGIPNSSLVSYMQGYVGGTPVLTVNRSAVSGTNVAIGYVMQALGTSTGLGMYGATYVNSTGTGLLFKSVGVEGTSVADVPSATTYGKVVGLRGTTFVRGNGGTITESIGGFFSAYGGGIGATAATITNNIAVSAYNSCTAGACSPLTIHNNYGFYAEDLHGVGDTQNAGLFIEDQGTGATDYAIYVAGGRSIFPLISTLTNCSDSAGAAACGAAPAGTFVVDAAATSTVVSTTSVTANSEIFLQIDASLGTRLSVTCNTQAASVFNPRVTARTAGTSFTVTIDAGPTTNPLCISYHVLN